MVPIVGSQCQESRRAFQMQSSKLAFAKIQETSSLLRGMAKASQAGQAIECCETIAWHGANRGGAPFQLHEQSTVELWHFYLALCWMGSERSCEFWLRVYSAQVGTAMMDWIEAACYMYLPRLHQGRNSAGIRDCPFFFNDCF